MLESYTNQSPTFLVQTNHRIYKMPVSRFLQCAPPPGSTIDSSSPANAIKEVARTIQETLNPANLMIGSVIQEPNVYQIIAEESHESGIDSDMPGPIDIMQSVPRADFRVDFGASLFDAEGPATGKVVEYVQHFFPSSQATPAFRSKIEQDFCKFIEGFSQGGVPGRLGWKFGWTMEDLDHADIANENATSFIIVVGWRSMDDFERSIQREAFRTSIGILLAWKAPYKMVCHDGSQCKLDTDIP